MRAKAILFALAALPLISSCAADPATPAATPSAAQVRADRDGCLIGTWKVDINDMAQQAADQLSAGSTGTGTGDVTVIFGDRMSINYDTVIDMNGTVNGQAVVVKAKVTGDASSNDWTAKDGNLAGTMATNAVTTETSGTVGGAAVPVTVTPFTGALDLAPGALGYTCGGTTATFTTPTLTWHLNKA